MAASAEAAATGSSCFLTCNPTPHHHFFSFFHSDPSPLRIRNTLITNAYALSSSNSLTFPTTTSTTSSSSSSGPRPSMAVAAESSMNRGSEEERQAARVARLCQQFFLDPSQWWDKRSVKENSEAPDFKHKTTENALWINDRFSPSWLQAKLVSLTQKTPPPPSSSYSMSSPSSSNFHISSGAGEAFRTNQVWEEFLSDPSQWWDNRDDDRRNSRFPDFKHKNATKALWIHSRLNPRWIHARLAAMGQSQEHGQSVTEISSRVIRMERLWQDFFSDPSQWWDNRFIKRSPKYPDFKHKSTHEGLWIESGLNPPWIKAKMATVEFGQIQSGCGLRSWMPDSFGNVDNLSKLCQEGRLKEALHIVELMVQQSTQAPINVYVGLMKACAKKKALAECKRVHALIVLSGLDSDIFLGNTLVDMYAKCGSVLDARQVFNSMREHNLFSWTAIISAYGDHGQGHEAINLFQQMKQTGIEPDKVAFVVVLKACARIGSLEQGEQFHSDTIERGFESDVIVGNTLVDMYAKCRCIERARQVFNKMSGRNVFSWSVMIAGYAQQGLGKEALALYEQMKQEDVQPNNVTYVVLLNACASIAALEQGKQLHSHIIKSGFESDVVVGNTLIDMYAKCGSIEHALQVFKNMHERNVVSWNAMIAGYAHHGLVKEALAMYGQLIEEGGQTNKVTFAVLLKACASIAALEQGKQLHSHIIKSCFESDVMVCSALVDMYAKCGCTEDAREVFNNMNERDVVAWNAMIAGYAQQGLGNEALALYEQMKKECLQSNNVTYVVLLKAFASTAALEQVKQLHSDIIRSGFASDVSVGNTLIDTYAKCGCIEDAGNVFFEMNERDVITWTAMIAGYTQQGLGKEALALYEQMKQEDVQPDNFTYAALLNACASVAALEQGKELHSHIIISGFELDVIVENALVDMYGKCGSIEHAREVFNNMNERNVVSWNAMIGGFAQHGLGKEAFVLYEQMKQEAVEINDVTFVILLKACASMASLEQGKQLHSDIIKSGFRSNVIVGNALVDMYAKCGCVEDAHAVFNNMHERNLVSWNSIIAGYAQQGLGKEALTLLDQMQREGTKPNEVTFVTVLSACSHCGLVDEGRHIFHSMYENHAVTPTMDHYACMVDLLGRAGCLADAEDFVNRIPIQPDAVVWMTLLGAARNHANVKIGRHAFDSVMKLQPENAAAYVLLSNIYAAAGRRDEVANLREEMKDVGVQRQPG